MGSGHESPALINISYFGQQPTWCPYNNCKLRLYRVLAVEKGPHQTCTLAKLSLYQTSQGWTRCVAHVLGLKMDPRLLKSENLDDGDSFLDRETRLYEKNPPVLICHSCRRFW